MIIDSNAAACLSPDLMAFNLMPSQTLHASRLHLFTNDTAAGQLPPEWRAHWHRYCSRLILERLELTERPVTDAGLPQLRLALLPVERLHGCLRQLGAVLCGPRLRRAIAGAEVRALVAGIGEPLMRFARGDAANLHGGMPETAAWSLHKTLDAMEPLGVAALMSAFRDAGEPLALRAELKLPLVDAVAVPLDGGQALSLATDLLDLADSS